jgi:small GTP-binding protein
MGAEKYKIVIFGSSNSGKSTFIRSLDPNSRHIDVNTDDGPTTVALDFGRVQIGDARVFLFGTPGQERFGFAREILSRGMHGAIVMIDSTLDIDTNTLELFEWLESIHVPFVIMLNKCDHEYSFPNAFDEYLRPGYSHTISALKGDNVYEALSEFVNRLKVLSMQNK